MTIKKAEFFKSVFDPREFPKLSFPEYVFAGRSNVGKSSLINSICNRKNLAKTSSTPGKTQSVNYFLINDELFFVDLPGYGFAKSSASDQIKWKHLIESYMKNTKNINMILILIDIRHGLLEKDIHMIDWAEYYQYPFSIILTKSDKISNNDIRSSEIKTKQILNTYSCLKDIISFSSKNYRGNQQILGLFQ
jgi:GTP-binding protein